MAALAAARTGAKTLLVEHYGFVGGMATAGLMTSFNGFRNEHPPDHVQTVRGIAQELVDRLREAGGACACMSHGHFGQLKPGQRPYAVSFDSEILKQVALEMLCESGVDLMLHTTFSDALTENGNVGFEIPYRSLVPADLDNVLLAGRCISASQPAFQSARSMAPNMAISRASGTAAAMCVVDGCRPADLDVTALQQRLESNGAVVRIPPEERS